MTNTPQLRGMANISFWAEDLKAAKEWYTKLLGVEPYFQDWITASVVDPFGNIIGFIHGPHYKEIWDSFHQT
ncbi:glyoxalase/bleomycin resistance/dioxygenase family protein [Paenibacillus glucanolyticus]|jgi:catechol 2,3-dioxygenase-like lactoylglutathione lyase family enzyme|uniref:glyoxalase/bleomycin resistance/dioxygenase family protein n=1 Tax=Paenibacillus TaxID=44249 RepID=UPI0003E2AC32|nr:MULTISPECIES: glyoxalase/bleomycin resistance/dioxygenase family protein [Paenibacillus]ANA80096.1 hypothetical protein A3958_08930 [Paenibacillus glucanolyticus]AVV55880.1 glyoxalase/bleomycin resistance/dioxygenase family protein [Paenibacillus glucanolyticus]AWP30411.1 glyoxalase/bleomycin resistance/dioxygenase family protein [Paenibacillus sp. Cedars]ETT38489.1 dioxygenase [Paenibacillus sp. FSL R5-808]MPY19316.1 glyoxalase/bleomycin resistance/dioxygenase family protein [Paenibacillus